MLENYARVAVRRMQREKTYVLISVLSLALGIASFLILALYLRSELLYDQHHENHDRIYRITTRFHSEGSDPSNFALSQVGIGPLLVKDYPQLGRHVRFRRAAQAVLRHENNERLWDSVYLADAAVFDVFTHKIVYGDVKTAFDHPYSIALSESAARYYFGDTNPVGKKMTRADMTVAVTLVFEDLPENTHLKYDALLPFDLLQILNPQYVSNYSSNLWGVDLFTYLMVTPEFDARDFPRIQQRFVEQYMGERSRSLKTAVEAELQPLADIHFGERLEGDLPVGDIFYVYGFAAVATFILLVACINYMNLATARAAKRAKEVGMRKVLGASKAQLVGQFLGESATFTAIALLLGLVLVEIVLALTPVGSLMDKQHLVDARSEPAVLLGIVGLSALVAVMSGLYPAFYLSAISPLAALTHVKKSWRTGFAVRQVLVFIQLSMSIGVIACTLLMMKQMNYIHGKPLGFDKENRLLVTLRGYEVAKNTDVIKEEIRRVPNVLRVTATGDVPGTGYGSALRGIETSAGTIEPTRTDQIMVGVNFLDAMNVKVVQGRAFSEDIATDAVEAVMVNESFVRKMGWEEPLGKRVAGGPGRFFRVIGVVQDFHYASLHNPIGPLLLQPIQETFENVPVIQRRLVVSTLVVAMGPARIAETVKRVQDIVSAFDPNFQFEQVFLDDRLDDLYESEASLMQLTGIFAGTCIMIAVMGLFGLTAFTTEQRTKEIGIRKTLGASDWQILSMLSWRLLLLVILAAIPASALSYYAMDEWLAKFAYHASIGVPVFFLATALVGLIALLTVALQSSKTTRADPVQALRYE